MQEDVNTTIIFDVKLNVEKQIVELKANVNNADYLTSMLEIDLNYWEDFKTITFKKLNCWKYFEMNTLYFQIFITKENGEFEVHIYESWEDEIRDLENLEYEKNLNTFKHFVEYKVNLEVI